MVNVGFMNFYMSALRNMFLTSSIAIAMAGYSERLKNINNKRMTKVITLLILLVALAIGFKSTDDYKTMIKPHSKNKTLSEGEKAFIKEAQKWPLIAYFYMSFLGVLFFIILYRNLKLFQ